VRTVFFLLLFANLAFLAWAEWVDAPQPAPTNAAYAKLPRLKLVNELPASDAQPSGGRPSSGTARKTALEIPPSAARCVSIGPFDDQAGASRGALQLREKGLIPRQRVEKGEISKGFWVYIGGLKTDGEVAQVLRTLEQSHVDDAQVMPDGGDAHKVSVGLFSERERADRRAGSIQKLGLQPEVAERKLPATVFWMDVDVAPGAAAPTVEDALPVSGSGGAGPGAGAAASGGSHVGVVPCFPEHSPPDAAPTPDTSTPFRTKVAGAAPAPNVP
jgi:cell division septation protein DedD